MNPTDIIALYDQHINPSLVALLKFMGFDTSEVAAEGCIVRTADGREFIDCLGGFGVMSLGHRHPRVVSAVKDQLDRMPLSSRLLFNEKPARLGKLLADISPRDLQYCFFCNSGAEAVEGALKLSRLVTGKPGIIAAENGFHGKTFGSLSASGREVFRQPFAPLLPGFTHVPFGDADALDRAMTEDVGAVILEPIQGEGGVRVPPEDYLPAARAICDQHDALLILDEVQTGLGRTGTMFACQQSSVAPDIMLLAKALGGGVMPIGAIIGTPHVWKAFETNPLIHSSTFGGNPLACAAAIAAIEVTIEENLSERAAATGTVLQKSLLDIQKAHPSVICEVRGKGLLLGVEFAHEDIAGLVIAGLAQRNILAAYTLNLPKVIRFEPPLIIEENQISAVVTAFADSVSQTMDMLDL